MVTNNETIAAAPLTAKDFASNQEVKWCPGCGDYSILKQVQTVFPEFGVPKENIVFISGIGCAARFTYYMDTYGMHSIHGRATAIASGVKTQNPDLSVWVISGDGDALSIGGNHFLHMMRKNFDLNYLVFNNQIYGLTKGQYSPTSEKGKVAKSTPFGSVEEPLNPPEVALGARSTFVSRSLDRDPKHIQMVLR
ncbi:MAG: 2-oxoacid:ferredoxin oxidoreductase subunit beta, partial [Chitinophagia bacterium]|nr:2-oxoacid:ferredoxin oxidoreductase subunit beta [Chitinophagia bacterium]